MGKGQEMGERGYKGTRKNFVWVVMDMFIILMVRLYTYMSKLINVYTVCAVYSMSVVHQ